jgi:hypothetical protein
MENVRLKVEEEGRYMDDREASGRGWGAKAAFREVIPGPTVYEGGSRSDWDGSPKVIFPEND